MDELQRIIAAMEPEPALEEIAAAARRLLVHLDEKARVDFVVSLLGRSGADKVASLVDL